MMHESSLILKWGIRIIKMNADVEIAQFRGTPAHSHDSFFSSSTPGNYNNMIRASPPLMMPPTTVSNESQVPARRICSSCSFLRFGSKCARSVQQTKKWHQILSSIFQLHRLRPRSAPHLTSPYFTLKWSSLETSPWKLGKRVCACECVSVRTALEQRFLTHVCLSYFFYKAARRGNLIDHQRRLTKDGEKLNFFQISLLHVCGLQSLALLKKADNQNKRMLKKSMHYSV